MNRDTAIGPPGRLDKAQNEFYAGGPGTALQQLLAPTSHGLSLATIASPGPTAVSGGALGYFRRRRDLADRTFQMTRRDVLAGDGDRIAALTDGFATIRNAGHRWSAVGLYDVIDQHITACWLLPLDQHAFDAIWAV